VVLSVNAACSGYRPVPETDPRVRQEPHPLPGTGLTRLWHTRPIRGPSAPVALDSSTVYLGGGDRRVVAVDLETGRTRWSVRLTGPLVGGVIRGGDRIYAATDRPSGRVYALARASGSQVWDTRAGDIHAPLALIEDQLIALNRAGQVIALDAAAGTIRWRRAVPSTQVPPHSLGDGRVLITSHDSLYVLRLSDGRILERHPVPGTIVAPWAEHEGLLFAATGDSTIVALEQGTLAERWRVRLDAPLLTQPVLTDDTVFGVTRMGSVFRISWDPSPEITRLQETGWPATGAPALVGNWILAGGADGVLRAFRTSDGSESWRAALGRPFELAPVLLTDGDFLAIGGRGDLHRLRQ